MSTPVPAAAQPNGILLLDKPQGPTSHDMVSRTRRALGTRKVGHAGTLDPMATGLLVLGAGPSTRLLTYLVGLDKTYEATILLGVETTTDDAEGETIGEPAPVDEGVLAAIPAAVARLTGAIEQVPSAVSAIKVDGRRAYARVRAGEDVVLDARPVTVHEFRIAAVRAAEIDVVVRCSSGTYIRALARDLGRSLGVGAHLTALRRTAVGPFTVAETVELEPPVPLQAPTAVAARLFPLQRLTVDEAVALGQGKRVAVQGVDAPLVAATAPDERLVGLAERRGGALRTVVNFPVVQQEA